MAEVDNRSAMVGRKLKIGDNLDELATLETCKSLQLGKLGTSKSAYSNLLNIEAVGFDHVTTYFTILLEYLFYQGGGMSKRLD